jgi:hypothetical protein
MPAKVLVFEDKKDKKDSLIAAIPLNFLSNQIEP